MARPIRIEYEHALYHVTSRGNARNRIFKDDFDKELLLDVIGDAYQRFGFVIHAFVFMTNHFHLLMETPSPHLSASMHHINAVYTQAYHRRHKGVGHVFQGRFKAIVVERDDYYLELIRYIHLNPVRAHMVDNVDEYLHSGHRAIIDPTWAKRCLWYDRARILMNFGKNERKALAEYRAFVHAGVGCESPLKKVIGGYALGTKEFADKLWKKYVEGRDYRDVVGVRFPPGGITAKSVTEAVHAACDVEDADLRAAKKGRASANAWRDMALYILCKHSPLTQVEIGSAFGNISPQAVSIGAKRFSTLMRSDAQMRKTYERVLKHLNFKT